MAVGAALIAEQNSAGRFLGPGACRMQQRSGQCREDQKRAGKKALQTDIHICHFRIFRRGTSHPLDGILRPVGPKRLPL